MYAGYISKHWKNITARKHTSLIIKLINNQIDEKTDKFITLYFLFNIKLHLTRFSWWIRGHFFTPSIPHWLHAQMAPTDMNI